LRRKELVSHWRLFRFSNAQLVDRPSVCLRKAFSDEGDHTMSPKGSFHQMRADRTRNTTPLVVLIEWRPGAVLLSFFRSITSNCSQPPDVFEMTSVRPTDRPSTSCHLILARSLVIRFFLFFSLSILYVCSTKSPHDGLLPPPRPAGREASPPSLPLCTSIYTAQKADRNS